MDKTVVEQTIKAYLSDETKRYQDWYEDFYAPTGDTDTFEVAPPCSHNTRKKRFKQYFQEQQAVWREKICIEWEYSRKRKEYHEIERLIAVLVDYMATEGIATISILVIEGYLDHLCANACEE
ncbi:MAG TPA: hypothetical protein EYP59_16410 [Thiotrichaceae bacterium]|nr:hypothetical protein [Thiotrichaceae bacterium]